MSEIEEDIRQHSIHQALEAVITDIEGIRASAGLSRVLIYGAYALAHERFQKLVDSCSPGSGENTYLVPPEKRAQHTKLTAEMGRAERSLQIVPRSMLVALISQYDSFISSLVKALFALQPALLNSSSRTIELAELLTFSSIEEAKQSVLDAEIEALLRDSHHEQFSWLERRFEIKTLKDFDAWPEFVEITQRRNLFVHSDGKISKQYLGICKAHGVKVDELKVGEQLEADSSYIRKAVDVVFEVCVKLAQVLWRKVIPKETALASTSLLNIGYELLERKRYSLAIVIHDFAFLPAIKHSSPDDRLRLLINRANAYRLSGNTARCLELISSEHWGTYDVPFRLASHALKGELDRVCQCMRESGAGGRLAKSDYREWPLFEGLRESGEFKDTFREVFGEELFVPEVQDKSDKKLAVTFDALASLEDDFMVKIETRANKIRSGSGAVAIHESSTF